MAATVPGLVVRFSHPALSDPVDALLFGLAIVGAAFLLAWAAEAAQLDISAGLAIAVLAFIAVLPEYAVDMVFAWKGGHAFKANQDTALEALRRERLRLISVTPVRNSLEDYFMQKLRPAEATVGAKAGVKV